MHSGVFYFRYSGLGIRFGKVVSKMDCSINQQSASSSNESEGDVVEKLPFMLGKDLYSLIIAHHLFVFYIILYFAKNG